MQLSEQQGETLGFLLRHFVLTTQQAKDLDDAAADAWNQASGAFRCVKAREIFKQDPRVTRFDAATIILLVRVAWEIWKWLKANKVVTGAPSFGGAE